MFEYHGVTFSSEDLLEYLRKSRSDDPLLSVEEVLERHEKILDEWANRYLDGTVPEQNKFREVVSGETIAARPEFQKILRLMESPKYKAVFVVEVQRLSRGDLEDAGRLIKLLRYTNTFVITPQKTYDLNDEYDRDLFERELKRGNEYLEYIKKIMLRGRLESVKDGNFIGSSTPYGYDRDWIVEGKKKYPTLKINEDEASVVRMIFDMFVKQGMGEVSIARKLTDLGIKPRKNKIWSAASIRDMLDNDHYIGKVRWNWRKGVIIVEEGDIKEIRPKRKYGDYYVFDGKHPAIISEEMLEAARAKRGNGTRVKSDYALRNVLSGLIFCECGKAMTYRTYKDSNGKVRNAPRLLCNNQVYCQNTSVVYYEVLDKVADALKNHLKNLEFKIKNENKDAVANHNAIIKRLETRLEDLNKKELKQWEEYTEGGMPKNIFDKLNEKVVTEKKEIEQSLATARNSAPVVENYQEQAIRFEEAIKALNNPKASAEYKNKLLKTCITRINYKREKGNRWHQNPFELDIKLKIDD